MHLNWFFEQLECLAQMLNLTCWNHAGISEFLIIRGECDVHHRAGLVILDWKNPVAVFQEKCPKYFRKQRVKHDHQKSHCSSHPRKKSKQNDQFPSLDERVGLGNDERVHDLQTALAKHLTSQRQLIWSVTSHLKWTILVARAKATHRFTSLIQFHDPKKKITDHFWWLHVFFAPAQQRLCRRQGFAVKFRRDRNERRR